MAVKNTEEYISCHSHWENELRQLHEMLLHTDLKTDIKWGAPVYTIKEKNVVGIGAFKNHIAIWFFNGALLKENTTLLVNAQEGKTKALRQIRFKKGDQIKESELLPYIKEAIQNQKDGMLVKPDNDKVLILPPELNDVLKNDPELQNCFNELSPGKQREYSEYILQAKRQNTKISRIEKIIPMIKSGIGLNDKYKNC